MDTEHSERAKRIAEERAEVRKAYALEQTPEEAAAEGRFLEKLALMYLPEEGDAQ